jgi:2-iminobutanoate/2-iminopropanoate deaminase
MSHPIGPYRPAVRAGDFLILSGQTGVRDGELVDGLEAQTRQVIANLRAVLEDHGASLGDVVKTMVFLTSMADFSTMNVVYASEFGATRPARSTVAVAALPLGAAVEIEALAFLGDR